MQAGIYIARRSTLLMAGVMWVVLVSLNLSAQEGSVRSDVKTYHPKQLKKVYKERFSKIDKQTKSLKKSLAAFEEEADTLVSDSVLTTFANIGQLIKSRVEVPDEKQLKAEVAGKVPKRYLRQYHRLNRKWELKKAKWEQFARQDSTLRHYWKTVKSDSVLLSRAEKRLTEHLSKQAAAQLAGRESLTKEAKGVFKQLDGFTDPDEAYKQLLDGAFEYPAKALESLPEDAAAGPLAKKGALLADTHNQLWKLKQKYSYLGNSNDLSTAVKQNSLQAYSFAARLRPGGTFQFHPARRGFRVDLRPNLGYKINRKLVVGLGGFYRASFGKPDALVAHHAYGASIFGRQVLFRRFFLHLEVEYASAKTPVANRETTKRINTNSLLLGIGKSFLLTEKLNGTVLWLYHFNHANTSAYTSPWGFRLGINLNQTH